MEIVSESVITLDTNCFIYYFEDNEKYAPKLEILFNQTQNGLLQANMVHSFYVGDFSKT